MSFDRDRCREVLWHAMVAPRSDLIDALAGCVTDDPFTIDRDALEIAIDDAAEAAHEGSWSATTRAEHTDAILALLRPVRSSDLDAAEYDNLVSDYANRARVAEERIAKLKALPIWGPAEYSGQDVYDADDVRAILRGES